MTHEHKYSIGDIENLIPFELDIYVNMINDLAQEK